MFRLNGTTYSLEKNIFGDTVIHEVEQKTDNYATEQPGSSIPFPVIDRISNIVPENLTVFIINNSDVVSITNGIVYYSKFKLQTDIFAAFPLVKSLQEDHRDLVMEMNGIIREYANVLCDEAIKNVSLISKAIHKQRNHLIYNNKRAMFDQRQLFELSWVAMRIQTLANQIVQFNVKKNQ